MTEALLKRGELSNALATVKRMSNESRKQLRGQLVHEYLEGSERSPEDWLETLESVDWTIADLEAEATKLETYRDNLRLYRAGEQAKRDITEIGQRRAQRSEQLNRQVTTLREHAAAEDSIDQQALNEAMRRQTAGADAGVKLRNQIPEKILTELEPIESEVATLLQQRAQILDFDQSRKMVGVFTSDRRQSTQEQLSEIEGRLKQLGDQRLTIETRWLSAE